MTWLFRCSERGGGLSGDHPGPQAAPVRPRALFVQALALPGRGHDQAGRLLDGTKLRTNASKTQGDELRPHVGEGGGPRREVSTRPKTPSRREPAWRRAARGIAASGTRLATIREAKAALTEEARQAARERTGTTADRRRGLRAVFQRGGRGRREASGIAATDVHTNAVDAGNLMPMTEQTAANTGQVLADSHYYSTDNSDRAAEFAAEQGI
ncbi:MAG: hypothetical protein EOP16_02425 [Pseudonocardia sp.]|nr:MAG: hypothetical protein EOP16_02425 [Pseudonocardia sp.]